MGEVRDERDAALLEVRELHDELQLREVHDELKLHEVRCSEASAASAPMLREPSQSLAQLEHLAGHQVTELREELTQHQEYLTRTHSQVDALANALAGRT